MFETPRLREACEFEVVCSGTLKHERGSSTGGSERTGHKADIEGRELLDLGRPLNSPACPTSMEGLYTSAWSVPAELSLRGCPATLRVTSKPSLECQSAINAR